MAGERFIVRGYFVKFEKMRVIATYQQSQITYEFFVVGDSKARELS